MTPLEFFLYFLYFIKSRLPSFCNNKGILLLQVIIKVNRIGRWKNANLFCPFLLCSKLQALKRDQRTPTPIYGSSYNFSFMHAIEKKILKKQFDSLWLAAADASSSVRHKLYINGVRQKEILKKWSLRIFIYR